MKSLFGWSGAALRHIWGSWQYEAVMQFGEGGSAKKNVGCYGSRWLTLEKLEERAVPAGAELAELIRIEAGAPTRTEGYDNRTGGTAYRFQLATYPNAPVTITLAADDERLAIGSDTDNSFTLTDFTQSWVNLYAKEDDIATGDRLTKIDVVVASEDPRFNGVLEDQIQLTIIDNDFLVTTTADSGAGSLRQAILDSRSIDYRSTIRFDRSLSGTTIKTAGNFFTTNAVTIDASALPDGVAIEQQDAQSLNRFITSSQLELRNLTIRGFRGSPTGGAIVSNGGVLRIEGCVFEGNAAGRGGAISIEKPHSYSFTNVEIIRSRFGGPGDENGNRATISEGGAIYLAPQAGRVVIRDSVFDHNSAITNGGAIASHGEIYLVGTAVVHNSAIYGAGVQFSKGTAWLANSTLSGNVATFSGGGVHNNGAVVRISSTTIAANRAEKYGGGIATDGSGPVRTILNSVIVAGNTGGSVQAGLPSDLSGSTPEASGPVLISDPNSALGFQSGSGGHIIGKTDAEGNHVLLPIDEILFPLGENGGPTPTHALRTGSRAIDRGRQLTIDLPNGREQLTTDQRGEGFSRVVGVAADIGSFEFQPNRAPSIHSPDVVYVLPGRVNVSTVAAADVDVPTQSLSYSIAGGDDAAAFEISADGLLSFKSVPDPTAPGDDNGDNRYQVAIVVADGWGGTATQQLTVVVLEASPWKNHADPVDVDDDGWVAPIDALAIINELHFRIHSDPVTGALPGFSGGQSLESYLDVNGDGNVTPIDALLVINELHRQATASSDFASTEGSDSAARRSAARDQSTESAADPLGPKQPGLEPDAAISADAFMAASWFFSMAHGDDKKHQEGARAPLMEFHH